MAFIDPTEQNLTGNTNYEKLNIYVDLTAQRRGFTSVNSDNNEITEIASGNFNLMGYKSNTNGFKLFTTEYSEQYNNDTDTKGFGEGFGITNISIEVNSSYVPTVKIDFVDIKGMAFFNRREDSPYSVLFDFPPPIFNLTLKGYYGKGLEYKLHLLRQNTRFEAETGNYYISAEFVANTFAPLADILYQYALTSSKINNEENTIDSTRPVNNLQELIIQSKKIKEEIATKLSEITNETNKKITEYKIIESLLKTEIDLANNIKHIEIRSIPTTNFILNDNKFTIQNFNSQSEYFLIIPIKNILNNAFIPTEGVNERKLLNDFYQQNFINNDRFKFFGLDRTNIPNILSSENGVIDGVKIEDSIILYTNITSLYNNINSIAKNQINNINIDKDDIVNQTKKIVINRLGFTPTIKNVMEIICDDIDKWISILGETYNKSIDNIVVNRNNILNNLRPSIRNKEKLKIYPFPDYIENSQKTIPKGNLSNIPENELVDNFIDAFIELRNERSREPINTDQINDINGTNVWFPVNPMDSTFYNDANTSPYNGLGRVQDVIRKMFARYYIYNYFTLTSSVENPQIFNNIIRSFFNAEFNVIKFSINQDKTLKGLKELNLEPNTGTANDIFIKNLSEKLEFNFIKENDINDILLNVIDIDKTFEFFGIKFTNKRNVLGNIISDGGDSVRTSFRGNIGITREIIKNENYLLENPGNNYFLNNENQNILLDDNKYKLKQLKSKDFGLTLNDKNNIIYYDGDDNNKTSFESFKSENDFNQIILDSLNIKIGRDIGINVNRLIKNTFNINNIIYDYYYNENDKNKTIFGYLNILYIPNLKHIITVLMNKAIIAEMPFLIKLYISSYVYGIENNLIDADLNLFTDSDKSKFDPNNKDLIYNLLIKVNNASLINNHVNIRKDFINLLSNLTQSDKNEFINFYIKNNSDTFFYNNFNNLINKLRTDNSFINISDRVIDTIAFGIQKTKAKSYISTDIEDESILNDLKEKTTIIVKSNYTFSNKDSFNIFKNFENINEINKNIVLSFGNNDFIINLKNIFKRFETDLNDRIEDIEINNENQLLVSSERNKDTFDSIRIETYYSFKNFVDRWFSMPDGQDKVDVGKGFLITDPLLNKNRLFDLFTFVNRFYDKKDAENIIIDTTILADFEDDMNVNMLTVIGRLLNHSGFEFYPLQNFIDYTTVNEDGKWDNNIVFGAEIGRSNILSGPRFTCMYIGGKSMYLDNGNTNNSVFDNDGFDSNNMPNDSEGNQTNWFGFLVRFGDGKQSIFTQIELNTDEHQPTNESLSTMSQILDKGENTAVPVYQNLFSTYEQRSYTCKIKMFGNVMIQPTQLFDLRNVPMFSGVYIILKVNHTIDGETNSMITEFEGVRLPKEPRPFITDPFEVYGKNLLGFYDYDDNRVKTDTKPRPERSLERKDRKIYLVAGHNTVNQPGASSFIDGVELREEVLNIELRNLIRDSLVNNNIDVEIDNDTKTLKQVVNDLNSKVQENDIVVDIHFNSSSNTNDNPPGNGTEVFIEDGTNSFIINLAEKVVNAIDNTLGIGKRKSEFRNLPTGVKLKSESYIEASAKGSLIMFTINANVILIEVCFINNPNEITIYNKNKQKLAEAIAKVLTDATVTETDKTFETIETFEILNTLKYDNVNNRSTPFIIENKNDLKNRIENNILRSQEYYEYKVSGINTRIADVFKNISKSDYINLVFSQIELSAQKYQIDAMFITSIINVESKFNPAALSETGALGITQFIKKSALIEVFIRLQGNRTVKTNVYVFENSGFIEKNISYSEILNILLKNLNNVNIDSNFVTYLKQIQGAQLTILEKNIFNNPFIMIELSCIYFKILEKRDRTKNLGILSLSYNIGSVTHNYNEKSPRPYFDNIIAKYNQAVKTNNTRVINGILREDGGQGLPYPEEVIDFLVKLGIVNRGELVKGKINL